MALLAGVIGSLSIGCSGGKGPTGSPALREQRATNLVARLAAGNYENARKHFNFIMGLGLSAGALEKVWEGMEGRFGVFSQRIWMSHEEQKGYEIVWVGLQFESGTMKAKLVFDSGDKITGLFFQPWNPKWKAPNYVDGTAFTELEITVGSGGWELPGTLTLPKNVASPPAVVLVHGSGPMDRDETIGPNKPFKDLAWGLASQGIAVLRYEKRTKAYPGKLSQEKSFTMKDETVDDAVLAIRELQHRDDIDRTAIYVLGHSQGGYCAPRIAAGVSGLAGFVSMAGNTQPLEELIIVQTEYLSRQGSALQKDLQDMRLAAEHIKQLTKEDVDKRDVILGAPTSYWFDLREYHPVARANEFDGRILILHGGRDYQVGMEDFDGWTNGLVGHAKMRSKLFRNLNHLMMPGSGPSKPAEYNTPGHVSSEVVQVITEWINGEP